MLKSSCHVCEHFFNNPVAPFELAFIDIVAISARKSGNVGFRHFEEEENHTGYGMQKQAGVYVN